MLGQDTVTSCSLMVPDGGLGCLGRTSAPLGGPPGLHPSTETLLIAE